MKRIMILVTLLIGLLVIGIVLAQESGQPPVRFVTQIGEARPRGVQYDPNFDRMAYVDTQGQLVLADGTDYTPQTVLYDTGSYNAYKFSHDGRWLALAIETRIEVYDTATGELVSEFLPDGSLITEGPIYWAEDDELISFNTQVLAPRELRRSENDTVNLPYIFDWQANRRARSSILPNRVVAQPFFDLRNGFVFGDNGVFIAGYPQRLDVRQVSEDGFPVIGEITSTRNEPDPISVWESAFDDMMYIQAQGQPFFHQIDTAESRIVEIRTDLVYSNRDDLPDIAASEVLGIVGDDHTQDVPEFVRLWLGTPNNGQVSNPRTVELVDILLPTTAQAEIPYLLFKITNFRGIDVNVFYQIVPVFNDIALHPDGTQMTLRRSVENGDKLDTYSLVTGDWMHTITPSLSELGRGDHLLAYNGTGTTILNDFGRYDAATGDLISQNLQMNYGYDQFYFPQADGQIVTVNDQGRWVWDFFTGEVVNKLTLEPRGQVIQAENDLSRFLSQINVEGKLGYEIYDVASGDRRRIFFDDVPQRDLQQVYHSPSWEHYLVVYGDLSGQVYENPGNAIALYTMGEGMRWLIADDDLPFSSSREYGWLDDGTIYIRGVRNFIEPPERIYGIDYHGSGLPQCLVDAFPDSHTQWVGYWDNFVWQMRPDDVDRLAVRVCNALPTDEDGIDALFFPTATATRLPITPTPAGIAGVPECLTSRFPDEARDYAAIWREIIADLTAEEIEEQARLLCESLQGESLFFADRPVRDPNVEVMLIDIDTQIRRVGGFIPQEAPEPRPNTELIAELMRRAGLAVPNALQFSPDGRYMAGVNNRGFIEIYELLQPYELYAADATATEIGFQPTDVRRIGLRPTATRAFDSIGEPRPTITPTITHTPPPTIEATADLARRDDIEEICPAERVYTMDDLPPEWAVSGRILLRSEGIPESPLLVLQPEDGSIERDYESLDCGNCEFTFDQNWVRRGNVISRPDGSEAFNLEDMIEALAPELFNPREDGTNVYLEGEFEQLRALRFIDLSTVQYVYGVYDTAITDEQITTYTQRLDLETGEVVPPFQPPTLEPVMVDYRFPELIAIHNDVDPAWMLLRLPFATGSGAGVGYRYYLYNILSKEITYLARTLDDRGLHFDWHPLGRALYFRYLDSPANEWFRLDTETGQVGLMGRLPDGLWSRDGRYRFNEYFLPYEERLALEEAGKISHFFEVWDSETGLSRRYCTPLYTDHFIETARWSPDNRYVLILSAYTLLPETEDDAPVFRSTATPTVSSPPPPETEDDGPVRIVNYLLFDIETGYITELTDEDLSIIIWTLDEEQQ